MADWTLTTLLQSGGLSDALRAFNKWGPGYKTDEFLSREFVGLDPDTRTELTSLATAAANAAAIATQALGDNPLPIADIPKSPLDQPDTLTLEIVATVRNPITGQRVRRPVTVVVPQDTGAETIKQFIARMIRQYFEEQSPKISPKVVRSDQYTIYSVTRGESSDES
jgi:hypothetical protein